MSKLSSWLKSCMTFFNHLLVIGITSIRVGIIVNALGITCNHISITFYVRPMISCHNYISVVSHIIFRNTNVLHSYFHEMHLCSLILISPRVRLIIEGCRHFLSQT